MELLQTLKEKGFLISDGGYGAILQSRGLDPEDSAEFWNLTRPQEIEELHRSFIAAGSQLIQTNTFQANLLSLARHGSEDSVEEINRTAVEIARRAARAQDIFVVGSIGPTGELLEPFGVLNKEEAEHVFLEQAKALANAGVDGFFIETFVAIEEAEIAASAAKQTGLPVAVSMAFQTVGATVMGVTPQQAAARLAAAGADIIGANCGIGPAELFPIVQELKKHYSGLTLAQPNAGIPQLISGKTTFPATPELMAEYAVRFRDLGVNIIGGCCGTRPEHIRAMAKALRG